MFGCFPAPVWGFLLLRTARRLTTAIGMKQEQASWKHVESCTIEYAAAGGYESMLYIELGCDDGFDLPVRTNTAPVPLPASHATDELGDHACGDAATTLPPLPAPCVVDGTLQELTVLSHYKG